MEPYAAPSLHLDYVYGKPWYDGVERAPNIPKERCS